MNELPTVSGSGIMRALVDAGFHVEAFCFGQALLEKDSFLVLVPCVPELDELLLRRVLKAAAMSVPELRARLASLGVRDLTG